MRWAAQSAGADDGALPGLDRAGLVRMTTSPEFEGIVFHEVLARSALTTVPDDAHLPFKYTVTTMRGCSPACQHCCARPRYDHLDANPTGDVDAALMVKINIAAVLRKELRRRSWRRDTVALGTDDDPYQRAEERYALMPGVISALAEAGTPISILTKDTLLRRDLPLLRSARSEVGVQIGVSLAMLDDQLATQLDPGAPSPRARLDLVSALAEAGFDPHVIVTPIVPYLTDSIEQLDELLATVAAAGAARITAVPLQLRGSMRAAFLDWLTTTHPALLRHYRSLYGRGGYVRPEYAVRLRAKMTPLVTHHGLARPDRAPEPHPVSSPSAHRLESTLALF